MNNAFLCSIVIATYNRCELLAETLQSLKVHLDDCGLAGLVEVLVVNNNSTDATQEVASSFVPKFECLRVIVEPKQGLSHGRNAGIAAAQGDLVVFLDDDVEVCAKWLASLLQPFENDKIAVVGGKVLPFGDASLPDWLPREYGYLVSVFDPQDKASEVDKVMGANFAVRKSALEQVGGFNVNLGRMGKKLLGGEEVELFGKIRGLGFSVYFEPRSIVLHKIGDKLNKKYISDYAYWLGVSEASLDPVVSGRTKYLLKLLRSYVFPCSFYLIAKLFKPKPICEVWFLIKRQYARGYTSAERAIK